jgi:hypothetical protein
MPSHAHARVATRDYLAHKVRRMTRGLSLRVADLALLRAVAASLPAPERAALDRAMRRELRGLAAAEERRARALDHLTRLGGRDRAIALCGARGSDGDGPGGGGGGTVP